MITSHLLKVLGDEAMAYPTNGTLKQLLLYSETWWVKQLYHMDRDVVLGELFTSTNDIHIRAYDALRECFVWDLLFMFCYRCWIKITEPKWRKPNLYAINLHFHSSHYSIVHDKTDVIYIYKYHSWRYVSRLRINTTSLEDIVEIYTRYTSVTSVSLLVFEIWSFWVHNNK